MAYNSMTKLDSYTVGAGGVASVTFSNIPQTYTDLVVKISSRSNAANAEEIRLTFNGSTSGYSDRILYATNAAAASTTNSGSYIRWAGIINWTGTTANTFSSTDLYIPNYTSNNFKSVSSDNSQEDNGSVNYYESMDAGLWQNTSPITSMTLTSGISSFVQYSTFTLYGVYSQTDTPAAPTISSATDVGGGTASIAISSPLAVPYEVTSSPGSITATGMSPVQISGLSPQTSYTFTAKAVAPWGKSGASSASSSISMYNGYTALATVNVGAGGIATFDFSSIPSGYSHLQIRGIVRSTYATSSPASVALRFNSDSGTNYAIHELFGNGASAGTNRYTSTTIGYGASDATAFNAANIFGALVVDILDYSNTNKYKTVRSLNGYDANGSGEINFSSSLWMSTAAISTITILDNAATSLAQYSTFTLYGVK